MRPPLSLALAVLLGLPLPQKLALATEPNAASSRDQAVSEKPPFNLPLPTGGGVQFWTDHLCRDGFRLQQNALTGHWRLLDPRNVRRAWGSKPQCRQQLEAVHPGDADRPAKHHVVLLHGLMRTSASMKALQNRLQAEGVADVIRFSYASTRAPIAAHAAALREVLEGLPGQDRFSFVGHSLGNIVVRHLVGDLQADGDPRGLLPRCVSMVMLGPPNQGAIIARRLGPTLVYGWITGRSGMELGADWEALEPRLATPPFPFHIIAGQVNAPVENPLVKAEGDWVVALKETHLEGAASVETVPVLHSFLMENDKVIEKTVGYLKQHR